MSRGQRRTSDLPLWREPKLGNRGAGGIFLQGKKSSGPGLLLLDVIAAPTSRPATPPAVAIPPRTFNLSLGRAKKK
ncbi:hypothetical protein JJB98_20160 [Bradyrhizobium diazoefficiens]|nr:hypothetical protein [Bradyrhizobium diazoefficiens]QQO22084.1 hypothetical protein JJB98_20160 [Bradyrhizobium diazoefficiens]